MACSYMLGATSAATPLTTLYCVILIGFSASLMIAVPTVRPWVCDAQSPIGTTRRRVADNPPVLPNWRKAGRFHARHGIGL